MKVDLNTTKNLRVVLIDNLPAILLTHANQTYKFHHTAVMDLSIARQVFYRMRHAGSVNLNYFDPLHIEAREKFYLTSTTNRTSKNHIWNPKQADTYCHLWSSGNIKNFEILEDDSDIQMCVMCQSSYQKAKKNNLI